ncbi:hypothetical protein ST47_g5617 [Ascochyta rabiei]|uniref:CHAT domain-containing protein n=1 Tax=Didymella rabiei TaxID=5454 RepID=A0A163DLS7_DIDRA|nr:hypothetical protein ST47_g5617 [Ascochyta rabiei]
MDVFRVEPEFMSMLEDFDEESLLDFAALYENTESDSDIEIAILIQFLRFTKSSSPKYLEAALQQATKWAAATEAADPERSRRFQIVDMMLSVQLTHNESREMDQRPVSQAHPSIHILSFEFIQQWLQIIEMWDNMRNSNDPGNLAILTSAIRQIMPTTPQGFQHVVSWLCNTCIELLERFQEREQIEDLHSAVEIAGMAVDAALPGSVDQAICLGNLGNCLGKRSEKLVTMADRDRAIDVFEKAIELTPLDDSNRAIWQGSLGCRLIRRFEWTGLDIDLDHAVSVAEKAIEAIPPTHPNRATFLDNLGLCLGMEFKRSGSIESLNRAITVLEEALRLIPAESPEWVEIKANVSTWLSERSHLTDSAEDLDRAVKAAETAISTSIPGSQGHARGLKSLGSCLGQRYERYHHGSDINRAIEATETAVNLTPKTHPNHSAWSGNLGHHFFLRFEHTGSMDDLNRAINLSEKAANVDTRNVPELAVGYNNSAILLCTRFERAGKMEDITRAVEFARMAVDATPPGSPDRPGWMSNLGICLGRRFERTGSMSDLDSAIEFTKAAVNIVAPEHPDRARWLNNYALWLHTRFKRHKSLTDIDNCIEAAKTAIEITAADSPRLPVWQANLAVWLSDRAKRTKSVHDTDEAVKSAQMAVESTSAVHADRAARFNNLGLALWTRYELTSSAQDRDNAIAAVEAAIDASPPEYPQRALHLESLGNWLLERSRHSPADDDQNQALSCFEDGWACNSASPKDRISLARRAARIYASRGDWTNSSKFLASAMVLLPLVSPRMLEQDEKQHMISQFNGLASSAAAAALNAGKSGLEALELLEQGRCVISGLLLDMRTDLSELTERHPGIAAKFESLRDELDSPNRDAALSEKSLPSLQSQIDRRFEVDRNLTNVIATIRALPGFERFLLPPAQKELMTAANEGPIVIFNVNSYRCDAFIVQQELVQILPLPLLTEEELDLKLQQSLIPSAQTLEWLWTVTVCPCLESLHYTGPPSDDVWPHVWWIPTGALSQFPIHAAGLHLQRTGHTVIDRVMSSYSSSLKALVYSRRFRSRQDTAFVSDEALMIAMEATMLQDKLPYASKEIDMLVSLCASLQLTPVLPIPRKEEVLKRLTKCKIFHFAGHGHSDPSDPSQSCILLEDWVTNPLTVGDLQEIRIKDNSPFLGFLSACSTSSNKAKKLVDEGIHLVSAFQLAGFRHVIGTLWEVSDSHCVHVAQILYETLRDEGMTDAAVCYGLHVAVRALRDADVEIGLNGRNGEIVWDDDTTATAEASFYWVPYIHFGP